MSKTSEHIGETPHLIRHAGQLEPIPDDVAQNVGYKHDKLPNHHMAKTDNAWPLQINKLT